MKHGRLFVGNLSYLVTKADLEELFKPFGEVSSIGFKSKAGHAFVAMATPGMAEKALEKLHGTVFKGRALAVTPEVSRKQAKTAAMGKIVKKTRRPKKRPEQSPDTDGGPVRESPPASGLRGRPAERPGARTAAGSKRGRFEKAAGSGPAREPKGPHGPRSPRAKDAGRPVGDGPERGRFEQTGNSRPAGGKPRSGRPVGDGPGRDRFGKAAGGRPASGSRGPHGPQAKKPGRRSGGGFRDKRS